MSGERLIITARGIPRSKKNSKRIAHCGAFKKIVSSEAFMSWEDMAVLQLKHSPKWTGAYPVYAHYKFFVENRRKFDLGNMSEGINDVMQTVGIIEDDDYRHLIPVFHGAFCGVHVDPVNPRVVVLLADKPLTM